MFSAWYAQMRQEDEEDEDGQAKSDNLSDDIESEVEEESEEEEEEGDDSLESWLSQLYIDSSGEPSPSTWALANL